ncbi:MAG: hypothetical protein N3D18_11205 [Roseococcus sp.]|nr:hypothetical protein [Roseococcus sp.]
MPDHPVARRGEIALFALRFAVIACAASLIGVLGHVFWKIAST